jgi:hypothetical protein
MNIEALKEDIKDNELRLSQLRSIDTHQLSAEDAALIKSLEQKIAALKEELNEE